MLVVSLSSTSVRVNWSEVPDIDQNGVITQYEVEYSQTNFTLPTLPNPNTMRVDSDVFSVTLRDLLEFVVYTIRVRADTRAAEGSYSEAVYVTTDEDGQLNQLVVSLLLCHLFLCHSSCISPSERHCQQHWFY